MTDIEFRLLLEEIRRCAPSIRAIAEATGVTERQVTNWLRPNSDLANVRHSNKAALLRAAKHFGIEPELIAKTGDLWDFHKSYSVNLAAPPPASPALRAMKPIGPTVFGIPLFSPFGPASSPLTATAGRVTSLLASGAGMVTMKTFRSREFPEGVPPHAFDVTLDEGALEPGERASPIHVEEAGTFGHRAGLVTRFRTPSPCPEAWTADAAAAVRIAADCGDRLVVVSFTGWAKPSDTDRTLINSFDQTARIAIETKAEVLEVNVSCSTSTGRENRLQWNLPLLEQVCKTVRKAAGSRAILLKIGYMPPPMLAQLVKMTAPHVNGYSAINCEPVAAVRRSDSAAIFSDGALSGPPLFRLGLGVVRQLSEIREKEKYSYLIAGMGGVAREADVVTYLQAGADVVQATNVFFSDSLFAAKVHAHLEAGIRGRVPLHELNQMTALRNTSLAYSELASEGSTLGLRQAFIAVFAEWQECAEELRRSGHPLKRQPVPSVSEFKRRMKEARHARPSSR